MQVVGLHVIQGAFKAADLSDGQTVTTIGGATLTVSLSDGSVSFSAGDSTVTVLTADLMSCSGVLHIVDTVLTPGAGIPDAGIPDEGTPDEGAPDAGTPDEGTPDEGTPDAGTPDEGIPDEGVPDAGIPDEGTPDEGTPDEGTPAGCTSLFGIIEPAGELGNFETVVLVRALEPQPLMRNVSCEQYACCGCVTCHCAISAVQQQHIKLLT